MEQNDPTELIKAKFGDAAITRQESRDDIVTFWLPSDKLVPVLTYLKNEIDKPFLFLFDLTAIDERSRKKDNGYPSSYFTLVYALFSFGRNSFLRIKVSLTGDYPAVPSITKLWANSNWYEREVYDMFGIRFDGHPHLQRILMPLTWEGHPLRKEHPARATEMGPFRLWDEKTDREQAALQFRPEDWGMELHSEDSDFMFLNIGPQHPGTHGVLRIILQLDGEDIVDAVPEIGFHHRGAEKMAERQSWHTYIPYTDRIDYLGGVNNNLAYLLAVEKLAGITVPDRANVIRVMMCELFRIASHLVWFGTFAQDVGQLSPVFYMFTDRERVFDIVEAVCGGRMHPNWFRIGGVAQDLPVGWDSLVKKFLDYFPARLREYDKLVISMKFGHCVTNPGTREPTVLASAYATLHDISNGRMVMGIGRGDSAVRYIGDKPVRVAEFERRCAMVKEFMNGREVEWNDKPLKLAWVRPELPQIPMWVAGYGPKALAVAGRVGDGVIIQLADPVIIQWIMDTARKSAEEAGRDPEALQCIVCAPSHITDDIADARDQVRWFPAMVSNHVMDLIERYGFDSEIPHELTEYVRVRKFYDYDEHSRVGAKHGEFVTDEICDRFCVLGNAEQATAKLKELEAIGVDQFNIYLMTHGQDEDLSAYGKDIIPTFA